MPVMGDQVGLTLDRIVLATDFSRTSEKATGYAEGLAKRFSSTLTLAHVVDLSAATRCEDVAVGVTVDDTRHESAENQERLLAEMTMAGVRATAHTVESHNPASAVVSFARELRADLIVTATNAHHGLSKAILGSFAEGVIRHADCPVLTIGPNVDGAPEDPLSFHRIVFATDFSADAPRQAQLALSFAQDSRAKIYLYHVLDRLDEDFTEAIESELKFEAALEKLIPRSTYDLCSPECMVENGAVAPQILELADEVRADLIVLGAKHSTSWFTHLIQGTVDKVLAKAQCPVITVCSK